jgi:hypothetical protein
MNIFNFSDSQILTSFSEVPDKKQHRRALTDKGGAPGLKVVADNGQNVELADQFLVFQLNSLSDGPTILEASQVEPEIAGSDENPDVLAALEMLSFHVGSEEDVDGDTCATMRVNFGKDQSSSSNNFDTVFWSIAAGLRLYNQFKNEPSASKDLNGNFHRAFGNRPIEIPGGIGILSFDVIEHIEPPWWRKLLGFGQSNTAQQLVSLLGFPAVTMQAIAVVDELLDRLADSSPKTLFQSLPMRLALSQWSRDAYTGGNKRIRIGAMSPGFCVLARGRDYETIAGSNSVYYPQYGRLIPAHFSESEVVAGEDPFKSLTYAVFRIGMKAAKIDPTFNFPS